MKKIFILIVILGSTFFRLYAQDSINALDKNGKFHGKYKKFHSNGNLRYEGQFEHGKEMGIFKFYAITGEKHPIVVKDYSAQNDSISVKFFGLTGMLESEGKMMKKDRVGLWKYYFSDGKTLMSIENYKADKLDGLVKVFYKTGKITEISNYKDGKLHGNRKRFDEDEKIVEDLNYENGIIHGQAIIYDEHGEEYANGNYEKGIKVGEWMFKVNGEWIMTKTPEKFINNK